MNTREIRVTIHKEPTRYEDLCIALMEGHEYEGGHIMQYSELEEHGQMVAIFLLRDAEPTSS
jgi:hypothetical protein